VQDFVPAGHAAHLVRGLVRDELDLSAILSVYTEVRGYPPYHPGMMVALLLYAYSQGVYSSRRIARACEERPDFQAVTALNQPDFRTISEFHRRHLAALAGLFVKVLALCQRAGLVGLGHVAVDGTKLRANASKHKAMSYARMGQAEAELAHEVAQWLGRAEQGLPRNWRSNNGTVGSGFGQRFHAEPQVRQIAEVIGLGDPHDVSAVLLPLRSGAHQSHDPVGTAEKLGREHGRGIFRFVFRLG
jgi:transposase